MRTSCVGAGNAKRPQGFRRGNAQHRVGQGRVELGHERFRVALCQAQRRVHPRRAIQHRQRADHGRVEPGLARVRLLERLGRARARDEGAEAESLRLGRRRGEAEREAERARRNRPSSLDPHFFIQGRHPAARAAVHSSRPRLIPRSMRFHARWRRVARGNHCRAEQSAEWKPRFRELSDQAATKSRASPQVPELARPRTKRETAPADFTSMYTGARHYTKQRRRQKTAAGEQIAPLRLFPARLITALAVAADFTARLGPALSLSSPL